MADRIIDVMRKYDDAHGFNFYHNSTIKPGDTLILKMPRTSPGKRGVNDIGFAFKGDNVKVYGTLCKDYKDEEAIWQQVEPFNDVNKTVSYLKFENKGDSDAVVNVRAILN